MPEIVRGCPNLRMNIIAEHSQAFKRPGHCHTAPAVRMVAQCIGIWNLRGIAFISIVESKNLSATSGNTIDCIFEAVRIGEAFFFCRFLR
ncbi:hypothetical protein PO124_18805 [Bacillus licheniformis]|nr:hypothetical protein [Bacillus licheniformis]